MTEVDDALKLLKEKRITIEHRDKFQIWGGEIDQNNAVKFINSWDLSGMPYTIIEKFGEITIEKTPVRFSFDPELIRRIRIFGSSGDLELTRDDSSHMRWRYIGQVEPPADIKINAKDFWEENPAKRFFLDEREALLWGKCKNESMGESKEERKQWYHPRVAKARLFYPVNGSPRKVKICYKTLSENGCVSFVWYTKLKGGSDNE
jgi:ribosomal protein L28